MTLMPPLRGRAARLLGVPGRLRRAEESAVFRCASLRRRPRTLFLRSPQIDDLSHHLTGLHVKKAKIERHPGTFRQIA
jgi:hypothetical protein